MLNALLIRICLLHENLFHRNKFLVDIKVLRDAAANWSTF